MKTSSLEKARLFLRHHGFYVFLTRLVSYIETRIIILFCRTSLASRQFINTKTIKILRKQSDDIPSQELFNHIIPCINNMQGRHLTILVPNYLHQVFLQVAPIINEGKNRIFSYSEASAGLSHDIVIINRLMLNQIGEKLVDDLAMYFISLSNSAYYVAVHESLRHEFSEHESSSHLLQEIRHIVRSYQRIDEDRPIAIPEGFRFYVRKGTMDEDIIGEVKSEYLSWLGREGFTGKNVIDLGGHIGSFSILISGMLADNARIHCYEPSPENFQQIKRNIEINKLEAMITPHMEAVSSKPGKGVLYLSSDNTGGNKLNMVEPSADESAEVNITTLENIVSLFGDEVIDLIKIDVEGSEHDILMAATDILTNKVRYIIGEAGVSPKGDGVTLVDFLLENGFEVDHKGSAGLLLFYAKNRSLMAHRK